MPMVLSAISSPSISGGLGRAFIMLLLSSIWWPSFATSVGTPSATTTTRTNTITAMIPDEVHLSSHLSSQRRVRKFHWPLRNWIGSWKLRGAKRRPFKDAAGLNVENTGFEESEKVDKEHGNTTMAHCLVTENKEMNEQGELNFVRNPAAEEIDAVSKFDFNKWIDKNRGLTFAVVTLSGLFTTRHYWMPFFDKDTIQQKTLTFLESLRPDRPQDKWKALALYALAMTAWEFCGLSTIPVETTSAMVFGWSAGWYSLAGKLFGASAAFQAGRNLFAETARSRLSRFSAFQVLLQAEEGEEGSKSTHKRNAHPPWLTAFLMKYSMFPEPVKNFGSSLLPIHFWHFLLATFVHGGFFTFVWTFVGVDAAQRMQQQDIGLEQRTSRGLNVALFGAALKAFAMTPLAMAWWARDLQQRMKDNDATDDKDHSNKADLS